MKSILKNYFYLLMALTIVAGTSAYKVVNVQTGQWYEIDTNGANPSQDLVGEPTSNPSQDGACINQSRPTRCSVRVTHSNPSFDAEGLTVAQIVAAGGAIAQTMYWDL